MSPTAFNLRHLRVLAAAIREGSLSAAAKAIGISQPAATQAIGKLEAIAGTALLDRGGIRIAGTDAGILLAARAEAAAAALAAVLRSTRKGGIGGRPSAENDLTMAQIAALLAVADHGGYAAGAAALGLAQPTLHRAVAELERTIGLALVERRGRGVALTAAGERLAGAGRLLLAELQAGLDELAVLAGRDQGMIRIGTGRTALVRLLPQAIARFLAEHPPVVVVVEELEGGLAADRLRQGQVDAVLGSDGPAFRAKDILRTPLGEEPLVIAARSGHPLLAGPTPGPVRLAQAAWAVLPHGGQERAAWDKLFIEGGLYPPDPSVTLPSVPALLDLVGRSDLLTVVVESAVRASAGRLEMLGLPLPALRRTILATRIGWAPTPAQATFLEEVRSVAGTSMLSF